VIEMDIGLLIVRVVVGALFAVHGTQKLFGWFGGYGVKGTAGFMGQLRYRRPEVAAVAAGVFETGAGLLLVFGFVTPLAAAVIIGVMINAIFSAKLQQGLIGGYELDLLYAAIASGLAFMGAGDFSVDNALENAYGWDLAGPIWGIGALVLGAVIGLMVLASRAPAAAVVQRAAEATEGRRAA
jgi:putative oxidoreductase